MRPLSVRDADEAYQVSMWGEGYYRVTRNGHLAVSPLGSAGPSVDVPALLAHLRQEHSIGTPVVLRFPQILRDRVHRINNAFANALKENGCKGVRYRGVFPIKVNQRKEVVQELARAGRKWQHGLEVGSKAELVAALTMDPNRKSLLVVNGFKDEAFLEAACHATHFKDEVVIVLDEVGELPLILPLLDKLDRKPILGLRLKLRSKAPGKWALSGGEKSKFGFSIPEVLYAVDVLREAGHLDRVQMLHFHIGSQISDIRRIVQGVREAARMHAELVRLGVPLRLLDVGGGLAVDYDGSGSSGPNSANYTIEEYANSVVAQIKDVCDEHEVAVPDIISESGRAVVAHHALLAVDVMRRVPYLDVQPKGDQPRNDDPTPLVNLYITHDGVTAKNVYESFHDALQSREDLQNLFDLGHLDIEALGRAETLFRATLRKVKAMLEREDETDSEEYSLAASMLGHKLVCNFSLFQSIPDVWGVKQQFPILPLHRLREPASEVATLADITCDSDGEIRRFIDISGTKPDLPVHALRSGEPYLLGMALVGAYQDSLGDYHNLFGETAEAFVETAEDGSWTVTRVAAGSMVADMLEWVQYNPTDIRKKLKGRIQRIKHLNAEEARKLAKRFMDLLGSHTYLESGR